MSDPFLDGIMRRMEARKEMSDTPRTDAEPTYKTGIAQTRTVNIDFARQLERELAEKTRLLAEASKDAERYRWLREFGTRARIYVPANRGTEMEIASLEKLDSAIDSAIKELK